MMSLLLTLWLAVAQGQDPWAVIARADSAYIRGDEAEVVAVWHRQLDRQAHDWEAHLGLGTVALLRYDSAAAYAHFARLANEAPDPWATFGLRGLGLGWGAAGLLRPADSIFSLAMERPAARADDRLRWELPVLLARIRVRTRGPADGLAILDSLAPQLPGQPVARASFSCSRGEARMLSGVGGLDDARSGIDDATAGGDLRLRAYCRSVLAGALTNAGDLDSAVIALSGVIDDARAVRDRAREAVALQWRGFLYRSYGLYGTALRDLTGAVREAEGSGAVGVRAWAILNLAQMYLDLGDEVRASEYIREARRAFAAQGDRFQLAGIGAMEATLLLRAGAYGAALDAYRRVRDLGDSLGFRDLQVAAHQGVAHAALSTGQPEVARAEVAAMEWTLQRYQTQAWRGAMQYLALAVALHEGDLAEATRRVRLGLASLDTSDHVWRYHFAMRDAEVRARQGDLDGAAAAADSAFAALDRLRSRMDDRGLRLRAFQRSDDLSDPDLGFATVVAALAEGGRAADAFRLAERSRAGELLAELVRADAITRDPQPVSGIPPTAIDAEVTRAALPDSATALLVFVTGEGGEPTTALVVLRTGIVAYRLPPADSLRAVIQRFVALLRGGGDVPALAASLGTALFGALAADPTLANVDDLVIIPDGPLYDVPFAALQLPDGQYLVARWATSIAPSAAAVVHLWGRASRQDAPSALILADPPETGGLPPLPGARREARLVARYAPGSTIRRGAEAEEAWLKHAPLTRYRLLHFATHAMVDGSSGLAAGLVLAPGDGEDGLLQPGEVARLRLAVDLTVLSACRTATGPVFRGEGLQGLTSPLLAAGSRAVLATRWRVEDRYAAAFVARFYQELAAGGSMAEALRRTRVAALTAGDPPAAWAAYTLFGDGSVTLPLVIWSPRRVILAATLAILAVSSVAWLLRRRGGP